MQFFIESNVFRPGILTGITDAVDMLPPEYDDLLSILEWTRGTKRLVFDDSRFGLTERIRTYKNYLYSLLLDSGTFMFTCHKDRREIYLYYSEDKKNDLEYCDVGYSCLEIPIENEIISDICSYVARGTCTQRNDEGMSEIMAGEFKTLSSKGIVKIKLMPRMVIDPSDPLGTRLQRFLK